MSAGFPINTHKEYGDTGFPSNVPPLQAGWALRAEEEKHGKTFFDRGQQSCLFYLVSM